VKLKKTNPALFDLVQNLISGYKCEFRKMFGSPAFFVNGNMFAGAYGDYLFLRLSEEDRTEMMKSYSEVVPFEPLPGRIMKEYVSIPESVFCDETEFRVWIGKAHAYASTLKQKPKKSKKMSKTKS
jgi:TfoX/Sxy family transcriptional regulator of competence genes